MSTDWIKVSPEEFNSPKPTQPDAWEPVSAEEFNSFGLEPVEAGDGVIDAGVGGARRALSGVRTAFNVLSGDDDDVRRLSREAERIPQTEDQLAFHGAIQERTTGDEGLWGAIKDVAGAAWNEPVGAFHEMLAQLPNSAVVLGSMAAGAKAGAAAGATTFTPFGVGVGAILGGVAGLFLGNSTIETGYIAQEQVNQGEYDRVDALEKGLVKGGVITAFDAATIGVSRWLFSPAGKAARRATEGVLKKAGVNPLDDAAVTAAFKRDPGLRVATQRAAKRAAATEGIANHGIALGAESAGEGMGEYFGSAAAGLDASLQEAVLEAMMSVPQSTADIAVGKILARANDTNEQMVEEVASQPLDQPTEPNPKDVAIRDELLRSAEGRQMIIEEEFPEELEDDRVPAKPQPPKKKPTSGEIATTRRKLGEDRKTTYVKTPGVEKGTLADYAQRRQEYINLQSDLQDITERLESFGKMFEEEAEPGGKAVNQKELDKQLKAFEERGGERGKVPIGKQVTPEQNWIERAAAMIGGRQAPAIQPGSAMTPMDQDGLRQTLEEPEPGPNARLTGELQDLAAKKQALQDQLAQVDEQIQQWEQSDRGKIARGQEIAPAEPVKPKDWIERAARKVGGVEGPIGVPKRAPREVIKKFRDKSAMEAGNLKLSRHDRKGRGTFFAIRHGRKRLGHLGGHVKSTHSKSDYYKQLGISEGDFFDLYNTQIEEGIRGGGVYQEAVQKVADKFPNGLVTSKMQASPALHKALRKIPGHIETEDYFHILPRKKFRSEEAKNTSPIGAKAKITIPRSYKYPTELHGKTITGTIKKENKKSFEVTYEHGESKGYVLVPKDSIKYKSNILAGAKVGRVLRDSKTGVTREHVEEAFPGSTVFKHDKGLGAFLPNGRRIIIETDATIHVDPKSYARGYGNKNLEDVKVTASWSRIGPDGLIQLAKGTNRTDLLHESFHAAMELALTKEERGKIYEEFDKGDGIDPEEHAAEAYANWNPKQKHSIFRKIYDFFRRLFRATTPVSEETFEKVRSGEVWRRSEEGHRMGEEEYRKMGTFPSTWDKEKVSDLKEIRRKMALGTLREDMPEYKEAVKKYGAAITGHTIHHNKGTRFFVGKKTLYGKPRNSDIRIEVTKDTPYGKITHTEYYDGKDKKEWEAGRKPKKKLIQIIPGPIFSKNKATRVKEIDRAVQKNKKYAKWYEEWNRFMSQFEEKGIPRKTIDKYIKIQSILSAQTGPQANQQTFSTIVNALEKGGEVRVGKKSEGGIGVSDGDWKKIKNIWDGKDQDIKTLDEMKEAYGAKVGVYMATGLFPNTPDVVIDRHMPRLWGFNVSWSPVEGQQRFTVHDDLRKMITNDVKAAAERHKMTPGEVQAALWFESRLPDVEARSYQEAAQMGPHYLPASLRRATTVEPQNIIHYGKETRDIIRGSGLEEYHNHYSNQDVGKRKAMTTKDNPYIPYGYFYGPGVQPEAELKGKTPHLVKVEDGDIYDAYGDPLGYAKLAREINQSDPDAHFSNILARLVKERGGYKGFRVHMKGSGDWFAMFGDVSVGEIPVKTKARLSDVVEAVYKPPQNISDLHTHSVEAAKTLRKEIQDSVQARYPEIRVKTSRATVARFDGATSGQMENGLGVTLSGPVSSIKAAMAELVGLGKAQRMVIVENPTAKEKNGFVINFKIKEGVGLDNLQKMFDKYGLKEYNLEQASSGLYVDQFVGNWEADTIDTLKKIHQEVGEGHFDATEVASDVLGNLDNDLEKAQADYRKHIVAHFGETKGSEIYEQAYARGQAYKLAIQAGANAREVTQDRGQRSEEGRGEDSDLSESAPKQAGAVASPAEIRRVSQEYGLLYNGSEAGYHWFTDEAETKSTFIVKNLNDLPSKLKSIRENFKSVKYRAKDVPRVISDKFGRSERSIGEITSSAINGIKTKEFRDWVTTQIADRLNPIKQKVGKKAYQLERLVTGPQAVFAMLMRHGKLAWDKSGALTMDSKGDGFLPFLQGLGKDWNKFLYWVAAQRAEQLETEGRENWLSKEDRDEIFKWAGGKNNQKWSAAAKKLYEFNKNILDVAQKSGLINKDAREMWEQYYYVPFYRLLEDEQSRNEFMLAPYKSKKHISAQIKRLMGAENKLGDPLENLLHNWMHLISESMRNAARAEAFDSAIETDSGLVDWITDKKEMKEYRKSKGHRQEDGILTFQRNGKPVYFKVNDPQLFLAMTNMNTEKFDNIIMKMMRASKRALTYGATFGPAFRAANLIRDTLHTSMVQKSFRPFVDSGIGFVKAWRENDDYIKLMASGAGFGSSYVRGDDPQAAARYIKHILKKEGQGAGSRVLDSVSKLSGFWEKVGAASENAARVQLYARLKAQGKTHLDAAFEARDLLDFTMRGEANTVQFLTQVIPFLNARMQGLYKLGRTAFGSDIDARKNFYVRGTMLAAASLALWGAYKDDDRYKELEDWDKWTYYHFWLGKDHYRIPKPFEVGAIFSSMFESIANTMTSEEDAKHLLDFMGHTFTETFAIGTPQLFTPLMEQWANKSFFTGRPIIGQRLEGLKPEEQHEPWTSESMQVLGKKLGISPKRAEEMVRGYFATFGTFILGITDIAARNLLEFPERPVARMEDYPLLGRFVRSEPARYTKYQTRFYELFREIDETYRTINHYKRLGDLDAARDLVEQERGGLKFKKGFTKVKNQLSKLNRQIRKVLASDADGQKKREMIDTLTQKKNELVKQIYQYYRDKS